ncbi:MAG: M1 family metallopeptidase [Candidatus Saccharimonadales bacterium]
MSKKVTRLLDSFVPEHYALQMNLDPEAMTFSGSVIVRGKKVGRPSQRITFHQKGLDITDATVRRSDKNEKIFTVSRINKQDSYDEVRIHCTEMVYPGKYTVKLGFSGKITRNMEGIYPCFFEENGNEKKIIATQFESHHAREAFPCIDEPAAKATFGLTLTAPAGETVLANTPIKTQNTIDNNFVTTFETTPKMSTYLLAFVYGDLRYKEATTKDGVLVRTYATPENSKHVDFALDVAVKTLEFYNEYFAIPYPLAKCDMVALPDFASGAMENWGLITYREQCMLVDPANTSLPNKQYVAMVVAHELAHQWFGNLVTMRWWTDLWLNEGFASWIEYLATNHNFPDWNMWTQFIVDEQEQGLRMDSLEHTHPIEVAINHPDEIRTIFDAISYAKGSSVIHMLHEYLGKDTFRDGLRHYLKRHTYGNTDTVDLWAALEEVSGKPVREFMHAWTSQSGYPVVNANVSGDSVKLTQHRFQLNPTAKQDDNLWPVPLLTDSLDTTAAEFTGKTATFSVKTDAAAHLNHHRNGFYRTVYNGEHIAKLGELAKAGKLDALDRVGLLSDHSEAAKAGFVSTVDVLRLLDNYRGEDNSVVWDIIASLLTGIKTVMHDEELREQMKPFVRELVAGQLERLGWAPHKDESHFDSLLRPLIIGLAASSDTPAVLDEVKKRFDAMQKSEDIEPDLRSVIYNTTARKGGEAEYERLFTLYKASKSSEERVTLAASLTNFKQPELIDRSLKLITTDNVRLQDVGYWIAYSFMNRHGRDAAWQWLKKNWDWLQKNIGNDLSFARTPVYAARAYSSRDFLPEFNAFFDDKRTPALERAINQAVEIIEWQSAWRDRDLAAIKQFFA